MVCVVFNMVYVVNCSALMFGKFIEFYQPKKVYLVIALNIPPPPPQKKTAVSYASACIEEICICLRPYNILHRIQHAFSFKMIFRNIGNHLENECRYWISPYSLWYLQMFFSPKQSFRFCFFVSAKFWLMITFLLSNIFLSQHMRF